MIKTGLLDDNKLNKRGKLEKKILAKQKHLTILTAFFYLLRGRNGYF